MGQRIDERELRRRAIQGVRDEVEAFGSASADSFLIRHDGLTASVVPASPQRSLFNSVFYDDPAVLAEHVEELGQAYDSNGVRAWTVWVPDEDRDSAELLGGLGHVLDAAPRAMAMELADLCDEPVAPAGIARLAGDPEIAADLNDRAYGYGTDGFRAGLAGPSAIRWHCAYAGEEPRAGAPLYERLGFVDFGFIEMWELRR